jgi:hypothetical protein
MEIIFNVTTTNYSIKKKGKVRVLNNGGICAFQGLRVCLIVFWRLSFG